MGQAPEWLVVQLFDRPEWTASAAQPCFQRSSTVDLQQQRVLQSHRRALVWCAANPGLIPPPVGAPEGWSPATRQVDLLGKNVDVSTAAAAQQSVSAAHASLAGTDE